MDNGLPTGSKPTSVAKRLVEFCKQALPEDFVVTRVEMLRHFPYVENETCRRYHELLAKKNANTTRLSEAEKDELSALGADLKIKTLDETLLAAKDLANTYSNAVDVILRGGVIFFDRGEKSSRRVQETAQALLEKGTTEISGQVVPDVRDINLPQSDKNIDFGDSNANNSSAFTKAWKEIIVPLRGKVQHVLLISNRSYASHFAIATEQPETGLQAQERVFEERGGFFADYAAQDGRLGGVQLVKDRVRVRSRSDVEAFVRVPAFLSMVQKRFPEVTADELRAMGIIDFQNLANAIIRKNRSGALVLADCGVSELVLVALRAAMGTGVFKEEAADKAAAARAVASLVRANGVENIADTSGPDASKRSESAVKELVTRTAQALEGADAGAAEALAGALAGMALDAGAQDGTAWEKWADTLEGASPSGKTDAVRQAAEGIRRGLAIRKSTDGVRGAARETFSRSPDPRVSGSHLPEAEKEKWPLGGDYRAAFSLSGLADGKPTFSGAEFLAEIARREPGVTAVEADGGSGKSLLLAETARAWLENGCRAGAGETPVALALLDLRGEKIGSRDLERKILAAAQAGGVVLLDALDEADWSGTEPGKERELQEKFGVFLTGAARQNRARIVLASRHGRYAGDGARVRTEAFSTPQADAFVREYFDEKNNRLGAAEKSAVLREWDAADKSGGASETLGNPLTLALLCEAIEGGKKSGKNDAKSFTFYARNVGHLFEDVARLKLGPWTTSHQLAGNDDEELLVALKDAANRRTDGIMNGIGQIAYAISQGWEIKNNKVFRWLGDECWDIVATSFNTKNTRANPLTQFLRFCDDGKIAFTQESMREYFAARHVRKQVENQLKVPASSLPKSNGCTMTPRQVPSNGDTVIFDAWEDRLFEPENLASLEKTCYGKSSKNWFITLGQVSEEIMEIINTLTRELTLAEEELEIAQSKQCAVLDAFETATRTYADVCKTEVAVMDEIKSRPAQTNPLGQKMQMSQICIWLDDSKSRIERAKTAALSAKKENEMAAIDIDAKLHRLQEFATRLKGYRDQPNTNLHKRLSDAAQEIRRGFLSVGSLAGKVRKSLEDANNGLQFGTRANQAAIIAAENLLKSIEKKLEKSPSLARIAAHSEALLFCIRQNITDEPESLQLASDINIAKLGVDVAKSRLNVAHLAEAAKKTEAPLMPPRGSWDSIEKAKQDLETAENELEGMKTLAAELAVTKTKRAVEMVDILDKEIRSAEISIGLSQFTPEDAGAYEIAVIKALRHFIANVDLTGTSVVLERAAKTLPTNKSLPLVALLDEATVPHLNRLLFIEKFLGPWLSHHGIFLTSYTDPSDPPDVRRKTLLEILGRFPLKDPDDHAKVVQILTNLKFDTPSKTDNPAETTGA